VGLCSSLHLTLVMIELALTKQFSVYDVVEWRDPDRPHRRIEDYGLHGGYSKTNAHIFSQSIRRHGMCFVPDIVPEKTRDQTWSVVRKFTKNLLSHYDDSHDEFAGFDAEENNIVRMPRIGRGKHNIHFDPEFSPVHHAIAQLAKDSHFSEFLSYHLKIPVTLRETGLTMTRPLNRSPTFGLTEYVNSCKIHRFVSLLLITLCAVKSDLVKGWNGTATGRRESSLY
jgi:hypothetical protein